MSKTSPAPKNFPFLYIFPSTTSIVSPSFNSSNNSSPTLSIISILFSVNIPGPLLGYLPLIEGAAFMTSFILASTKEFAATSSMSI